MEILREGQSGNEVLKLQRLLVSNGYPCGLDGNFGTETKKTVIRFQRSEGLEPDGVVGNSTKYALMGVSSVNLAPHHIKRAAVSLGVETAAVYAVQQVESRASGFVGVSQPVILYERHVMRRRLRANGLDNQSIAKFVRLMPGVVSKKSGGYVGGEKEYDRLFVAKAIDENSALESCSWGLFQIMGYHWKRLGYKSVVEFVDLMSRSEPDQLEAFVRFIKADKKLWQALRLKQWAKFARRYNGPAYKKNKYDKKMATAFAAYHSKI